MRSRVLSIPMIMILALSAVMAGNPAATARKTPGNRYTAYYFHGKLRCPTCLKIEKLSAESLRANEADMFRRGVLAWKAVNIDLPENEHFRKEFGLTASALVFVCEEGGKVKRSRLVDEVWEWVNEPEADFGQKVDEAFSRFVANRK
ncbi:MAG: hypothetical protein KA419_05200 [Acidobacteria bacterium]|nr:hypothetical protein [Acidobacteriota bacterium]